MTIYLVKGYLDVAATTLADAQLLIAALADPSDETNAATIDRVTGKLETLVQSDTGEPLVISSIDDANGTISSWVTDASVVNVGLGDPDSHNSRVYCSLTGLTVSGNTRIGTLALNTTELQAALSGYYGKPGRVNSAPFTLHIQTLSGGTTETRALLRVDVRPGVLTAQPTDLAPASYLSAAQIAAGYAPLVSPAFTTPNIGAATGTGLSGLAATNLILAGGSSGAALVLGKGADGGARLTTAGSVVSAARADATLEFQDVSFPFLDLYMTRSPNSGVGTDEGAVAIHGHDGGGNLVKVASISAAFADTASGASKGVVRINATSNNADHVNLRVFSDGISLFGSSDTVSPGSNITHSTGSFQTDIGGGFIVGSGGANAGLDMKGARSGAVLGGFAWNTSTAANSDAAWGFQTQGSRTVNLLLSRATGLLEITDGFGTRGTVRASIDPLNGNTITAGTLTALGAAQNVTGSRGGNAALASLLTKLAAIGLITDSTS